MIPNLNLNLGQEEFVTAVNTQPKPLIIPLCAEFPLPDLSPLDLYRGIRAGCGFLLESMDGSEKLARYSFIGIEPEMIVTIGATVGIQGNEPFVAIARDPEGNNPVDRIRSILSRFHYMNVKAPRFFGGMVGYFAYDCVYSLFEKVPRKERCNEEYDDMHHDARFMLAKDCIVIDHRDKKLYIFSSPFLTYDSDLAGEYHRSVAKIQALADRIAFLGQESHDPPRCNREKPQVPAVPGGSRQSFEKAVGCIKEHIVAGDIFQAVISRRLDFPVCNDPFTMYEALREINPSPYMYYLDFGEEKVIGASPEMLVRVEKRQVTTVPIAGTRPRGRTTHEDDQLAKELLSDKKERAEHTMLVDLARNDLGRVCRFGSVTVGEFMGIEKFSHVQHIVSTVSGTLRDNLDCYDAFKSCFPAGTVSGAPKIRAMQIIDEQEPGARGLYAGAVGYIGFDRNLDFAIAIRTIQVKKDRAYVQVGAGIVADSVPENEWNETENKAAAMIRAIEHSGACS
ncbi:anthranilate synthase component I [Methanoregula sp.]|uniref:anthranilate synthase component I n=1 Tax=Methanoregula sp. TaxID=2052170 RepID=UPI00236E411D|nr:anthranilate synthase component I [Methanoregula sp.]MDD1687337.1 anthranilate synthase component I [Methanoregula sp.]